MNASRAGLSVLSILGLAALLCMMPPPTNPSQGGGHSLWAQGEEERTNPASETTAPPSETPAELPHGKFLLDYLLVLALIAIALYAVCRSSRRV